MELAKQIRAPSQQRGFSTVRLGWTPDRNVTVLECPAITLSDPVKTKAKVSLGIFSGTLVLLAVAFLPRLVRTIDAGLGPAMEKAAANEMHYQNMTNAYPIASEVVSSHPTRQLWEESKAVLVEAGYIETREIPLRHGLTRKGAANEFFFAFHARFPGVECGLKAAESDLPVAIVTARKSDFGTFGPIERWIRRYEPKP